MSSPPHTTLTMAFQLKGYAVFSLDTYVPAPARMVQQQIQDATAQPADQLVLLTSGYPLQFISEHCAADESNVKVVLRPDPAQQPGTIRLNWRYVTRTVDMAVWAGCATVACLKAKLRQMYSDFPDACRAYTNGDELGDNVPLRFLTDFVSTHTVVFTTVEPRIKKYSSAVLTGIPVDDVHSSSSVVAEVPGDTLLRAPQPVIDPMKFPPLKEVMTRLSCYEQGNRSYHTASLSNLRLRNFTISPRPIAFGANGEVYAATFRSMTVAIKKLWDIPSLDSTDFDKEYKIPLKYPHENICRVLDYFTDATLNPSPEEKNFGTGKTTYFVMEFYDQSLLEIVQHQTIWEERELLLILLQVAKALDHLNRNGIAHRDLKLGDVMVNSDGSVHVVDFGCAATKLLSSEVEGNPMCHPPELRATSGYVERDWSKCDVWALGSLCFDILGISPCNRSQAINSAFSSINTLVKYCLQPNPLMRVSASTVVTLLENFLWANEFSMVQTLSSDDQHFLETYFRTSTDINRKVGTLCFLLLKELNGLPIGTFPKVEQRLLAQHLSKFCVGGVDSTQGYQVSFDQGNLIDDIVNMEFPKLQVLKCCARLRQRGIFRITADEILDELQHVNDADSVVPEPQLLSQAEEIARQAQEDRNEQAQLKRLLQDSKFSDFTIKLQIGISQERRGQYGVNALVYLVSHHSSARSFAMKVLLNFDQTADHSAALELLFTEEFNLPFDHPNVLSVLHHFNDNVVPELLPGWYQSPYYVPASRGGPAADRTTFIIMTPFHCNLKTFLRGQSEFRICDESSKIHMLLQLSLGLQHVTGLNYIHQDLKLDNILVDLRSSRPRVVISDFGCNFQVRNISKVAPETITNRRGGNPIHRAPELRVTKLTDDFLDLSKADLWGLGVIAYEMFSGQKADCFSQTPIIIPKITGCGPDTRDVIQACLRINATERPSWDELITLWRVLLWGPQVADLFLHPTVLTPKIRDWHSVLSSSDMARDPYCNAYLLNFDMATAQQTANKFLKF
ncbi:PTEN induced putative kinase 1 [Pelomyxa schiedti]|nr:PTEN induced putative kinase 1 [Pelomyxa schiedti]